MIFYLLILAIGVVIGVGITIYDIGKNDASILLRLILKRQATSPSTNNKKFVTKHKRQQSIRHNQTIIEKHNPKEVLQNVDDVDQTQEQLRTSGQIEPDKKNQTYFIDDQGASQTLISQNLIHQTQIQSVQKSGNRSSEPEYIITSKRAINKTVFEEIRTLTEIYNTKVRKCNEYSIIIELKSPLFFKQTLENQKTVVIIMIKFTKNYPRSPPIFLIKNKDELYNAQISILEKKFIEYQPPMFSFILELEDILFEIDQQRFRKFDPQTFDQSQTTSYKGGTMIKSISKKDLSNKPSQEVSKREISDPIQFKNLILGKRNEAVLADKQQQQQFIKLDYDYDEDDEELDDDEIFLNLPQPQQLESCNFSRFAQDFEDIQKIGSGGFGKVFKAKNRLDGNYYAIKQVLLDYEDQITCQKTKNEAIFLSRLQHIHIVRYYQSWTEEIQKDRRKYTIQVDSVSSGSQIEIKTNNQKHKKSLSIQKSVNNKSSVDDSLQTDEMDSSETFNNLKTDDKNAPQQGSQILEYESEEQEFDGPNYDEADIDIQWEDNGNAYSISEDDDKKQDIVLKSKNQDKNLNKSQKLQKHQASESPQYQFLYIQMEYCKEKTLKDWIDSKQLTKQQKKNIISQILEALSYLHQKRYIHRDLKPQNIFLDDSLNVKLGDFGLATEIKTEMLIEKGHIEQLRRAYSVSEGLNECHLNELTKNIGTTLYLAPEQEHSSVYDQKVDMFSLGIIMFEMYYEFGTEMGRYNTLRDLKNNQNFPQDFDKQVGKDGTDPVDIREKINSLIQKNSQKRPESKDFLLEYQDTQFQEQIMWIVKSKNSDYITMIQKLFDAKLFQHSVRSNLDLNNTYLEVFMLLKKEKLKENILWKEFVRESLLFDYELECLFKRYGSHRYDLNTLCLANNLVILKRQDESIQTFQLSNPRIVYMLSEQGVMYQYSNNFIEPLVQIVNSDLTKHFFKRRYSFAEIMTHSPTQLNIQDRRKAVAYDILWKQKPEEDDLTPLYLSELFALIIDILNVLVDTHKYLIRISHTQLFECIVKGLHLSDDFMIRFYRSNDIQTKIKTYFTSNDEHNRDEVLELLQSKFFINKIDAQKFSRLILCKHNSAQVMYDRIMEDIIDPEIKTHIKSIFDELNNFHEVLRTNQLNQVQIQFENFSFAETRHYYQGIHFEVVERIQINKKSDVVSQRFINSVPVRSARKHTTQTANPGQDQKYHELSLIVGGCYSNYLNNDFGCGIQIQSEILLFRRFCKYLIQRRNDDSMTFQAVKQIVCQYTHSQKPFQMDVIIYSEPGEILVNEKLKLANQIRRAGYSAVYLPIGNKAKYGQFQFKLQIQLKQRGKEVDQIFNIIQIKGRIKWTDPKVKSDHDVNWDQLFDTILLKLKRDVE